jgi:dissimilatory sulfite reductase (desulfoviridin) alpha/beta subunit
MSEEEQISRLKIEATTTVDKNTLKGLVDTLGTFGKGAHIELRQSMLFCLSSVQKQTKASYNMH